MDNNMADKIYKFLIKLYPSLFFMLFVGKMQNEYGFVGYINVEYCTSTFVLIPRQPQHSIIEFLIQFSLLFPMTGTLCRSGQNPMHYFMCQYNNHNLDWEMIWKI